MTDRKPFKVVSLREETPISFTRKRKARKTLGSTKKQRVDKKLELIAHSPRDMQIEYLSHLSLPELIQLAKSNKNNMVAVSSNLEAVALKLIANSKVKAGDELCYLAFQGGLTCPNPFENHYFLEHDLQFCEKYCKNPIDIPTFEMVHRLWAESINILENKSGELTWTSSDQKLHSESFHYISKIVLSVHCDYSTHYDVIEMEMNFIEKKIIVSAFNHAPRVIETKDIDEFFLAPISHVKSLQSINWHIYTDEEEDESLPVKKENVFLALSMHGNRQVRLPVTLSLQGHVEFPNLLGLEYYSTR